MLGSLAIVVTVCSLLSSTRAVFHPPAAIISLSPTLKPRIGKPTLQKREFEFVPGPLNRLLFARQQDACQSGFTNCTSAAGGCCPTGGECCTASNGCCDIGQFCYGSGCCSTGDFGCSGNSCCPTGANCCSGGGCCASTDNCVVLDGQEGCCPVGQTCSGAPIGCSLPGYDPCPGASYCCPTGDTCVTSSSGEPSCSGTDGTITDPGGVSTPVNPGGVSTPVNPGSVSTPVNPGGGSITTPSSTTRPIVTTSSSSPQVTSQPSAFSSGASTTKAANEHAFTQSFPAPGSGGSNAVNNTVAATDPRISYHGSSWATSSACGSTSEKASAAGDSLTFQFTGTAVFLNSVVNSNAGLFSVSIDGGDLADIDGFSVSASGCQINWSAFDLSNSLHTITVAFKGASPNANAGSSSASFELAGFIITSTGDSGSSASSAMGALTKPGKKWALCFWSGFAFSGFFFW